MDDFFVIVDLSKKIVPFLPFRWYSLMFIFGFLFGMFFLKRMYRKEGNKFYNDIVEQYLVYAFIGVLLGARLGHVFFYGWEYYSSNLMEIVKIWKGGLASHGGIVGLIITTLIFIYKNKAKYNLSYGSFFDKLVIMCLLTGALIRIGNFINGEIVGKPTNSTYGFVFLQDYKEYLEKNNFKILKTGVTKEPIIFIDVLKTKSISDTYFTNYIDINIRSLEVVSSYDNIIRLRAESIPRYPTQLFESTFYFLLFLVVLLGYRKARQLEWLTFGISITMVFLFRFFIEFVKETQVSFENYNALNQGQRLSIPFIIVGVGFILFPIRAYIKKTKLIYPKDK